LVENIGKSYSLGELLEKLELNPKIRKDYFIHSYLLKGLEDINRSKSEVYFYNYVKKTKLFSFDCANKNSWQFNSSSYFHQMNKEHKVNKEIKLINIRLNKIKRRQRTEKLIKLGLFFKDIGLTLEEPYEFVGYLLSLSNESKTNAYYMKLSKETRKTNLSDVHFTLRELKVFIEYGLLFHITKLLESDLEVLYGVIADFKGFYSEKGKLIEMGKEYYIKNRLKPRF